MRIDSSSNLQTSLLIRSVVIFIPDVVSILKTSISGDDFKINSDKATSIALIANELVQNSITHGFSGRPSGNIEIIVKQGKIKSKVTITDNGVGFKSKDIKNGSLGLQIVKSLVKEKLFGNLDIKSTKTGTVISFDFEN